MLFAVKFNLDLFDIKKDNEPLEDITETLSKISAIGEKNGHYNLLLHFRGSNDLSFTEISKYSYQFSNVLPAADILFGFSVLDAAKDDQVDLFTAFTTDEDIYDKGFERISDR